MRVAPEMDFKGNAPFWLKNEGFGLTLYFPAFRPEKEFFKKGCSEETRLVFGVCSDAVPMSFVVEIIRQGRLDGRLRKCWIRPEVTPSGFIVMAIGIADWKHKDENATAWRITQDAYNHASSWYRQRVKELWDQAKLAATYFSTPPEQERNDGDITVEVIEPARIEA